MDEKFEHSVDFDLLGRFATGEISPEDGLRAQEWIQESDENRQTWEAIQGIWEHAPHADDRELVNTDVAWNRVKSATGIGRIAGSNPAFAERKPRFGNYAQIMRIAASLVLALGLSLMAWYFVRGDKSQAIQQLVLVTGNDILQDTLPDGTIVTLNAGARLKYPSAFALAQREVKLEGEAFFEVSRNVRQPFVIHAGAANVRVLGTSFNVRSTKDEVAVVVATGKVELSAPKDQRTQAVILEPGNAATYKTKAGAIQKTLVENENFLFWKNRTLVYRGTQLNKVVEELQELFDVRINIDAESHGKCPLNTEFKDLSIESILNIIAETFNLEMTQNENTFTFSGEGCH